MCFCYWSPCHPLRSSIPGCQEYSSKSWQQIFLSLYTLFTDLSPGNLIPASAGDSQFVIAEQLTISIWCKICHNRWVKKSTFHEGFPVSSNVLIYMKAFKIFSYPEPDSHSTPENANLCRYNILPDIVIIAQGVIAAWFDLWLFLQGQVTLKSFRKDKSEIPLQTI